MGFLGCLVWPHRFFNQSINRFDISIHLNFYLFAFDPLPCWDSMCRGEAGSKVFQQPYNCSIIFPAISWKSPHLAHLKRWKNVIYRLVRCYYKSLRISSRFTHKTPNSRNAIFTHIRYRSLLSTMDQSAGIHAANSSFTNVTASPSSFIACPTVPNVCISNSSSGLTSVTSTTTLWLTMIPPNDG